MKKTKKPEEEAAIRGSSGILDLIMLKPGGNLDHILRLCAGEIH